MIVVGITGTLGAGKGTLVEYLVNEKGFLHYSVRSFLIKEIEKRGLVVNRDTMTLIANELRANHSPSYITDCLFEEALSKGVNCVIESIRTPGEIVSLQKKGRFILFAVDADPRIRFLRITKRKSETDSIDFETFLQNEAREMESDDANKQNLKACIKQADFVLDNNGTVADLIEKAEKVLQQIL